MSTARTWRETPQRYRLEASKCDKCGYVAFPHRHICPKCKNRSFTKFNMKSTGTIETFSVIRVAPSQFTDEVPYAIGIVKIDDGAKLTCQIVDCNIDSLQMGQKVRIEFRKIQEDGHHGVISYGYKAVPTV